MAGFMSKAAVAMLLDQTRDVGHRTQACWVGGHEPGLTEMGKVMAITQYMRGTMESDGYSENGRLYVDPAVWS